MTSSKQAPLVQVNVLKPKPGMMDAFIERQLKGLAGFGPVQGLISSRLYRANDDRDVVLVSEWESEAAMRLFMETPALQEHRKSQQPLLESASPAFYTIVYERPERDHVLHKG